MRSASPEARAFRNHLALLRSIDRYELEEAEVLPKGEDADGYWVLYVSDPVGFILRLDDDPLDRYFELLEQRASK